MKGLYLLVLLLAAAPVSAEEGFTLRWSYTGDKAFTSVSPIDAEKTGYLDHVLAGSLDNRVYMFSPNGEMLGYYEAMSSVTSVAPYNHDFDSKFNDGVAGSLDDNVYVFWRPYTKDYFKNLGIWWNYSLGDNVYAVGTFDYYEDGQFGGVLAGTGNYADEEYGAVYAFSDNGTLLWTYDTSSPVKIFANGDLDSDNILSDVIAGAGSKVFVFRPTGSLIWENDFTDEVTAISYADFDLDGEKDDMLIGAGNTTYAVNSHKDTQWEWTFNASISDITPVDADKDEVIDYYLVSSGNTIYALKNAPKTTEILWQYTLKHSIDHHTGIDLDKDGVPDDIAVISGKTLYVYNFDYFYLPELEVSKKTAENTVKVGDKVLINISFKNKGKGILNSVSYEDTVPAGLHLIDGNLSISNVNISASGEAEVSYILEALEPGNYTLPPVTAYYTDGYGNPHVAKSNSLNLTVTGPSSPNKNETVSPVMPTLNASSGAPKLDISRLVPETEVSDGENLTVLVSIVNQGNDPALTVNFDDTIPPGFTLVEGESSWKGTLKPGKKKDIQYTIRATNPGAKDKEVSFKAPVVYYRDESGKILEARGEDITLKVKGSPITGISKMVLAALIAALAIGFGYRRISATRKVDPRLEERFIQVYLRYQKQGKRPTYQDMREELGVEIKDIEAIVKNVKKRFGISPATSIFSRIRSLKK